MYFMIVKALYDSECSSGSYRRTLKREENCDCFFPGIIIYFFILLIAFHSRYPSSCFKRNFIVKGEFFILVMRDFERVIKLGFIKDESVRTIFKSLLHCIAWEIIKKKQ